MKKRKWGAYPRKAKSKKDRFEAHTADNRKVLEQFLPDKKDCKTFSGTYLAAPLK
jgi:hypothetical protein